MRHFFTLPELVTQLSRRVLASSRHGLLIPPAGFQ